MQTIEAYFAQYSHIEGKRPSFFQDLVFLLIGPLWVINRVLPQSLRLKD